MKKIQPTKPLLSLKEKIALERDKLGHKGKFGNVLVLGGWDNMRAANLASLSLRTGCGKVLFVLIIISFQMKSLEFQIILSNPKLLIILM